MPPLTLDEPPPATPRSHIPWIALLTRIAEETELDGSVRIAGDLLPVPSGRRPATALTDALLARYVRSPPHARRAAPMPTAGRGAAQACARLASALRPQFFGRDGWTFTYRDESGVPAFVVGAGTDPVAARGSCFLDLTPRVAPEVFAQLVTTLEGYGIGFRAELRGDPWFPDQVRAAVVTVARDSVAALVHIVLRTTERSPLLVGDSVPAFTRAVAPGIGLADEPHDGTPFDRHRCRLIAAALVAAGPAAGP
ncbi:MAG: hypothetical protein JWQ99_2974, partial [Blastococcus sp.]|nr:hypothetical protein [Blastococcus sp.]